MKKHLYEIKRLDIPAYLKWWFIRYRSAGTLSEVLENLTSPITLTNALKRRFKIFEIGGNSEQENYTGVQAMYKYQNGVSVYAFGEIGDTTTLAVLNNNGMKPLTGQTGRCRYVCKVKPSTTYYFKAITSTYAYRIYSIEGETLTLQKLRKLE